MRSVESPVRRYIPSGTAILGGLFTSAVLFFAIASTNLVILRPKEAEEPLLTYALPPPPPPTPLLEQRAAGGPQLSASVAESFDFDPTRTGPAPEIPLGLLDIRLNPHADIGAGGALGVAMQHTFAVQKPPDINQLVIFERDQVDEIPIWLYGPMPKVPGSYQRTDYDMLVLYTVSDKGRTSNVYVLDSNVPELVPQVKEAITKWTFQPARKDGKAVQVWVQHTVTYRPSSKSPFSL